MISLRTQKLLSKYVSHPSGLTFQGNTYICVCVCVCEMARSEEDESVIILLSFDSFLMD